MRWLRRWLLVESPPINLAVFRITVAVVLLSYADVYSASQWAALPDSLRVAPSGWGGWLAGLPISPVHMHAAQAVLIASLVCGGIGLWSRTCFLIATVAGFYVLGVPQLAGTVVHDHHLLWFTALLAASPCGDALSLDAWRKGRPTNGAQPAYGLPIRIAWLLLGIIFFFPGTWKLRASGFAWIWSENLRNQMYWKWAQTGTVPFLRVDRFPWLCRLCALGVVALELSFPFLIFIDRLRPWVVAAALLFHVGASYWMGIHYSIVWACYLVFVDWSALVPPAVLTTQRSVWSPAIVGSVLVLASGAYGLLGITNAWPFACYPTFQWTAPETMPALVIEATHVDGTTEVLRNETASGAEGITRHWGLAWSLAGVGVPTDERRLAEYWRSIAEQPDVVAFKNRANEIRFYRAVKSVIPEESDRPPVRRDLLLTLAPD